LASNSNTIPIHTGTELHHISRTQWTALTEQLAAYCNMPQLPSKLYPIYIKHSLPFISLHMVSYFIQKQAIATSSQHFAYSPRVITRRYRRAIRFIQGISPYRAVNTFHYGYKNQSVNEVLSKSRCLFWNPYKTLNTKRAPCRIF